MNTSLTSEHFGSITRARCRLAPVEATADFVVAREDTAGGSGANFLVDWVAQTQVVEPLAESIMVGTGCRNKENADTAKEE